MVSIKRVQVGLVTVLRLHGDLDEDGAYALHVGLLECVKERRRRVVVNFSDVQIVSYLSVGVLVEKLRWLRKYGGNMKLAGLNCDVQSLFMRMGVTSILELYETEFQAIGMFNEAA